MTSDGASPHVDLVRHDITISNILYGGAHLITLRLPEAWDIASGVGRPEIMAAHSLRGRRWVASGRAWYVLYHRQLGWAMELLVESGAIHKRRQPNRDGELTEVHGHAASVRRRQRRRGVLRPKIITFIEVTYNCEQSNRFMRMEISGRCPSEGFEEMLRLISGWWCH